MDPNIHEPETAGRKRSHTEFADDSPKAKMDLDLKTSPSGDLLPTMMDLGTGTDFAVVPAVSRDRAESPPNGSPALTDAGRSTPALEPNSPQTPSKTPNQPNVARSASPDASGSVGNADSKPAIKRKRLTPQEKEAREKEIADKKKEKEAQAAARAAQKAKLEEDKAARAKERDEKRKKKEEEDQAKAEKKRKKEEEQKRAQEEKEKKERSQMKLNNFFQLPKTPKTPAAESNSNAASPVKASAAGATPKSTLTEYERLFKPFFVRENTRLAALPTQMDDETRDAKSRILDEFIGGHREVDKSPKPFDAVELLRLPGKLPRRGRLHHPVRHILETLQKETDRLADSGNALEQARQKLAKVPMKVIAFSQDVRPPYYGTVTLKPFVLGHGNMSRQARRTTDRRLPLDYDYDSEAEWQDEEGEDIDIDDDEEEQDDEDDMDGFLDDSEDAGLARRIFANTMEPDSSGICFEDASRPSADCLLREFKMEFVHGRLPFPSLPSQNQWDSKLTFCRSEGLNDTLGIDPWTTQYWEPEVKKMAPKTDQAGEETSKMAPPPAPGNAFEALRTTAEAGAPKLVKQELMGGIQKVILANKALSKVSIIDIIFHQFRDDVSRTEVKNTIELIAEKKGNGRSKEWDIKPAYKIQL
ncbi:hypothetical protein HIM_06064 [Hirsutella minnesotensis 3608]|uniref:Chromatin assembly factor 1 subunit A n=1 Tax=Hirsutella minnesotensis 3608 TaxID=1043627 RepID=A0A0F7ZU94_9HYPO|nr:hypothetical protein HIM_06064 [Hirsutella minnesotensis 3608]